MDDAWDDGGGFEPQEPQQEQQQQQLPSKRPRPRPRPWLPRVPGAAAVGGALGRLAMSISVRDELAIYGRLAYNLLLGPKYDLYKIPGPPGYWLWGERVSEWRARTAGEAPCSAFLSAPPPCRRSPQKTH